MTEKKSFVLYLDYFPAFEKLSLSERGELITAIFEYAKTGIEPDLNPVLEMAFSFIRQSMDRDNIKWEQTKKARAEAGRKGGLESGKSRRFESDDD